MRLSSFSRPPVLLFLALALPLTAASSAAQTAAAPSAQQLQAANALFVARDWSAALNAYRDLSTRFPTHALSRFRTGVALVELGKPAEGEQALRDGERLGIAASQAAYRIAQALTEQNRSDAAIGELLRSAHAGMFLGPQALESDAHVGKLRTHARWPEVLDAFDAVARPCMHDARFREFDFWVGDWDVRPTGQPAQGPAARNTITKDDNGCVLTEHWSAPSGSMGQSFNIFDRSYGVWRQTWVDNVGGQNDYRGGLKEGNMVFLGDTPIPGGGLGRVPTRLTFFHISADSVRQFSEVSTDSARTWQVSY